MEGLNTNELTIYIKWEIRLLFKSHGPFIVAGWKQYSGITTNLGGNSGADPDEYCISS